MAGNFKTIIEKIKNSFKNIFEKKHQKLIQEPKFEQNSDSTYEERKSKIFDIYNRIKKGEYPLEDLSEEQIKQINAILNTEISIKKRELQTKNTELKMLQKENMSNEKI